jgi:hypothetical protein
MSPDLVAPEYRREVAVVHIAHVLEMLLVDKPIDPIKSIYTNEYMAVLGFGNMTPHDLLHRHVMPVLTKNRTRVPPDIHNIIFKVGPRD